MPGKYINPYTDFGFKRIFGQEAHKDILIAFLNSLLPERHQIAGLRFRNTEMTPARAKIYVPTLDLYCESPSGERFIVEMQQKNQLFFMDRSVFYAACAIREQYELGQQDYRLAAVYFVGIMDFVYRIEGSEPELVKEVSLKDRRGFEMYDKLRMYFLQMPLFTKAEGELATPFDKWLYFLKNLPGLDHIPAVLGEPVFEKAFRIAEFARMTADEEWAYFRACDALRDSKTLVVNARAEGLAEGKAEGLAEGRAEGIAKEKQETARKMKSLGMTVGNIAAVTGLPEEQINTALGM